MLKLVRQNERARLGGFERDQTQPNWFKWLMWFTHRVFG